MSFNRHAFAPSEFRDSLTAGPRPVSTGRVIRAGTPTRSYIPSTTVRTVGQPTIQRSLSPRVSQSYIVHRAPVQQVRVAAPQPIRTSVVRVAPAPAPQPVVVRPAPVVVERPVPVVVPRPAPQPAPVQNSTIVVDDEERYRTVASDYNGYGRHKVGDRPGDRVRTYNNRFNRDLKPLIVGGKNNGDEYRNDEGCSLI